ncbi:MAG: aminoacyl-tRNA hydrolase [Candidatus Pacebacteria bacterium]|nr:aminoacyl-tRNA hydrolase [Candidatus Paceibacterota bacterium]
MYLIVGLGNPGEEYEKTRHNLGRILLDYYVKKNNFPDWDLSSKKTNLFSEGKIGKKSVKLLKPEKFMNNSGKSILGAVLKHKVKSENLVIVYDDLDLALGEIKISFNRGAGGHKGIESIIKSLETKKFIRVRVGITPTTPTGKLKKPKGEKKILDFLMSDFSKKDMEIIKKTKTKIVKILDTLILEGRATTMNKFN